MKDRENKPVKFTGCRPMLRVSSLATSLRYYCNHMGFTHEWSLPERNTLGENEHQTFAYVFRGDFELLLSEEIPVGSPMTIVVGLPSVESVDELWSEFQKSMVNVTEPPSERPWGTYEMRVSDPDGHLLRILH